MARTPQPAAAAEWLGIRGDSIDDVAGRIASRVQETLQAKGLDRSRVADLGVVIQEIIGAVCCPGFERYHAFMISRGESLDDIAGGFCGAMKAWGVVGQHADAEWSGLSLEGQVRYVWDRPALRDFEWQQIDMQSVRCGFGLRYQSPSAEWPFPGSYSQLSLYAPTSGRLKSSDGIALSRTRASAWFSIQGSLASGYITTMRVNLYWDSAAQLWRPVTVVVSPDATHRPFPLL